MAGTALRHRTITATLAAALGCMITATAFAQAPAGNGNSSPPSQSSGNTPRHSEPGGAQDHGSSSGAADPGGSGAVPVMTTQAVRRDVPIDATGVGTIQAYQSVLVRARVDGELMAVPVTEGQMVHKGDLIASIDPRPYKATLDQTRARLAQDAAQLANAQHDLTRYASLARQDFASRQQLDTQQALVNQYAATVQGDAASVEAAQLNVDFCSITSPVDGRVGLRQVDPGNLVHATDTAGIVTITQVQPIALTFTLPQTTLPAIETGMAAGENAGKGATGQLPVHAYSADDRTDLSGGVLLTPDNTIDTSTGTIKLKAVFANRDGRLWPGQFVNAHLQLSVAKQAVTLPPAAVQHGPDGLYVYVVKSDGRVAEQPVSVGYQDEKTAIVTAGLSGGETVVLSGQSRLQPGTPVTTTEATAS